MTRNLYALLVGIDKYQQPDSPLSGYVNDITGTAEYLKEQVTKDQYQLQYPIFAEEENINNGDKEDRAITKESSKELGEVNYIAKPFQKQEFLVDVENQLHLKKLHKQLIEQSILEERQRIAREIHDSLAQAFTSIILHLGAAERSIEKTPAQALSHLQTVRELAKNGLAEARRSVEALRPKLLEDVDLHTALHQITTQMSSHSQTRTLLEVMGTVYPLPVEVENNVLRIAQEALTNAFKYAKARTINIELIYEFQQFFLRVKDNGQGFDVESPCFLNGFGFLGMKERADRMDAQLIITSEVGRGTEILVSVKL